MRWDTKLIVDGKEWWLKDYLKAEYGTRFKTEHKRRITSIVRHHSYKTGDVMAMTSELERLIKEIETGD